MVKYWHFNCANEGLSNNEENKKHMLNRNLAYIALASDEKDYNIRSKKRGSLIKQLQNFKINSDKGDIILLYKSKIGYISYGKYNGIITKPNNREEEAPNWPHKYYQEHIGVEKWIKISNPSTKYFFRPTLCMIRKNEDIIFNYIINQ